MLERSAALMSVVVFCFSPLPCLGIKEGGSRPSSSSQSCHSAFQEAFIDTSGYIIEVLSTPSHSILKLSGTARLSFGIGLEFIGELKKIPKDRDLILVLDSTGGSQKVFEYFARSLNEHLRPYLIRSWKNKRITTYVPEGAECTSACLALFMVGDKRIAHPGARFGFHGVGDTSTFGLISQGPEVTMKTLESWNVKWSFLNNLAKQGVFDRHLNRVTYLAPEQLSGTNILTEEPRALEIPLVP